MASTMLEMREFYDAFFPRLEEAIDYCESSRWTTSPRMH